MESNKGANATWIHHGRNVNFHRVTSREIAKVIFQGAEAIGEEPNATVVVCAAQSGSPVQFAICKILILGFINQGG
jgi:hypothetical protein